MQSVVRGRPPGLAPRRLRRLRQPGLALCAPPNYSRPGIPLSKLAKSESWVPKRERVLNRQGFDNGSRACLKLGEHKGERPG